MSLCIHESHEGSGVELGYMSFIYFAFYVLPELNYSKLE